MKIELKPCPFCGGEARLEYVLTGYRKYYVYCSNFDCGVRTKFVEVSGDYAAKEKAATIWNRRESE